MSPVNGDEKSSFPKATRNLRGRLGRPVKNASYDIARNSASLDLSQDVQYASKVVALFSVRNAHCPKPIINHCSPA
jgi:hypothetical protein